ncbi:MAG TPA: alpha/beta hydrolase-fold protein [Fimbriiglobus sp.]|nr:alpha/beta hydrolase-fold protein [Fimbriiglobus sp.]
MTRPHPRWPRFAAAAILAVLAAGTGRADFNLTPIGTAGRLDRVNRTLAGQVLDFTRNHGCDRRLFSPALGQRRDLYLYLPPGYDGRTAFPAMIWMHGIGQDEKDFLDLAPVFDAAIRAGRMPPLVIAAPDGSIRGRASLIQNGSFYVNSTAGRFEDYIIQDVWGFVRRNFAVRPEREAHVLGGASMGGFGAFNLGFKYRQEFGLLVGIMPPLDLRYVDCHGRYFANYDPNCVAYRTEMRPREVIGRFYGVVKVHSRQLLRPLLGRRDPTAIEFIAAENPVEMLAAYDVRPGEFGMFIGYGTEDEFNIDAQAEHFVDVACRRGIRPTVVPIPGGRHNRKTGLAMFPALARWLTERLVQYTPPGYTPVFIPHGTPLGAVRGPRLVPDPVYLPLVGPVSVPHRPSPPPARKLP